MNPLWFSAVWPSRYLLLYSPVSLRPAPFSQATQLGCSTRTLHTLTPALIPLIPTPPAHHRHTTHPLPPDPIHPLTLSIHSRIISICMLTGPGCLSPVKRQAICCAPQLMPRRALNTHIKSLRLNRFSFANLYRTGVQSASLEVYTP